MISSHQLLQFSQASSIVYTGWNRFSVGSALAHPGNATITTVGHFCSALCQSLSNKLLDLQYDQQYIKRYWSWKLRIRSGFRMYDFLSQPQLLWLPSRRHRTKQGVLHCKSCYCHLDWSPSQSCHTDGSSVRAAQVTLHILNIQNLWQAQNASSKQCISRYPDKVPELRTSKAILIFHLSLTDFLYCTLGLPFIVATLHYGYFP